MRMLARPAALLTTVALSVALTGCTAGQGDGPPAPASSSSPTDAPPAASPLADTADALAPTTVDLPASAPAPALSSETLGAAGPGIDAQFGELVTTLSLEYPTQYIEGEWRADEVPHGRIVLLGPVPDELRQLLEAAPLALEVVTTTGPSLEESNAAMGRVFELLTAHDAGMSASGGYDQLEQRYSIEYTAASPIDEAVVAASLGGAAARLSWLGTEPADGSGPQAEAEAQAEAL